MEADIRSYDEFIQRYWNYYLLLEKDFLHTERYAAIDELNFKTYSNEYIKQFQTICSEIDVISKSYCRELNRRFKGKTINMYCKCIVDNNPAFSSCTIKVIKKEFDLSPWKDWTYSVRTTERGHVIIEASKLEWWDKYNAIKHRRTTTNNETGLQYYKLANQENVINALAALYQLELYYLRLLHQKYFTSQPDIPTPVSSLFEIENWEDQWIMLGERMAIEF